MQSILFVSKLKTMSFPNHNTSLEGATKAQICAILLLLRCTFRWHPAWPKSNFSFSGRKPWTIVRRFDQISFPTHNSSLECATKLKLALIFSSYVPFQMASCLPKSEFSDSGRKPWTMVRCFDQVSFSTCKSSLEGVRNPEMPFPSLTKSFYGHGFNQISFHIYKSRSSGAQFVPFSSSV